MALVSSNGYAHVRITVTDIERSSAFYDLVFGWPRAIDTSDAVDEPGVTEDPQQFYGGVVYQTPQGTLFGLRPVGSTPSTPPAPGSTTSASPWTPAPTSRRRRTASTRPGSRHGEIIDLTDAGLAILSFQDPDDINIELTAPLS